VPRALLLTLGHSDRDKSAMRSSHTNSTVSTFLFRDIEFLWSCHVGVLSEGDEAVGIVANGKIVNYYMTLR